MRRILTGFCAALAATLTFACGARAADNDIQLGALTKAQLDSFVEEIGLAIAYNPVSPAEPLGVIGFDAGVSVSMVQIDDAIWSLAVADGDAPSSLPVPRAHFQKGLPFGIDIGLMYIAVPSSNVKVIGGEVRKAILEGTAATPAVSVAGSFSRLSGVDELDLGATTLGVGISKGFFIFTPYAQVDHVWIYGQEHANLFFGSSDTTAVRAMVGLKIALLPILNIVGQADFSTVNMYTVRVNLGL